jgi:hypothetical protein
MRQDKSPTTCDEPVQTDCGTGLRNRFFRGKSMGAEEFRIEQRHLIERRRLLNRAVVGDGVVYGFTLSRKERDDAPIEICPGFALDCHGAEIVSTVPHELKPAAAVILVADSTNCLRIDDAQKFAPGLWLLSVHYAERDLDRVTLKAGCDCPTEEFRYSCETLVFSLRALGACGCPRAEPECECRTSEQRTAECDPPTSHRCQCEAAKRTPGCGPYPERRGMREWRGLHFDPDAGVPLACVNIDVDPRKSCDPASFTGIADDCGPRPLVKTNRRLYDLIPRNLTRIARISWQTWHRRVQDGKEIPWEEFAAMFLPDAPTPGQKKPPERCPTNFTVHFSKPVKVETLTRDAFVIYGITREPGTAWGDVRRIPIVDIDTTPDPDEPAPCDGWSPELTNRARIVLRWGWYNDEVSPQCTESWFEDESIAIEIEIRGDLIRDCNDIAVDANPRGEYGVPTGNGTPGGTFVSAFRVAKKV